MDLRVLETQLLTGHGVYISAPSMTDHAIQEVNHRTHRLIPDEFCDEQVELEIVFGVRVWVVQVTRSRGEREIHPLNRDIVRSRRHGLTEKQFEHCSRRVDIAQSRTAVLHDVPDMSCRNGDIRMLDSRPPA